jgi:hypothetical protein
MPPRRHDGFEPLVPKDSRSRRISHAVEFSKTVPLGGEKKPPTRARGPQTADPDRIGWRPVGAPVSRWTGFLHYPFGQPRNSSSDGAGVKPPKTA